MKKQIKRVKSLADEPSMSPHIMLANEIVLQAIEDWQSLCKGRRESKSANFAELRRFFKSGYCDLLLQGTYLSGEYILKELEDLREATKYGTSQTTWQKRRTACKAE